MKWLRGTQSMFYVENLPFLTKFDTNKARTIVFKASDTHNSFNIWCYNFSLNEQDTKTAHKIASFLQNGDEKESWGASWNLLI